jgi:ProP effector
MDDRAAFDFRYRVIRKLAALFPKCFFEHSSDRLPLKVGIGHELEALELQIDPQELSYVLGWYTGSTGYLRAMKVGAARVGLNGTPAGVVSEADARHAAHEIARRGELRRNLRSRKPRMR